MFNCIKDEKCRLLLVEVAVVVLCCCRWAVKAVATASIDKDKTAAFIVAQGL